MNFTAQEKEIYLSRCLELAERALGNTYPNPMVGAVVVFNHQIIGEGWHQKSGAAHAEVNAIRQVEENYGEQAEELLKKSSLFVNLEPCAHFGKTPPCADLIVAKNIPHIVIGSLDPFHKVSGKGIKKLLEARRKVEIGTLEDKCLHLNRRFFSFHQKQRPYIILKWAESVDGFLRPEQQPETKPVWISNTVSRQIVHRWRSEEQGILVGGATVANDNPSLTTRDWPGNSPVRIVIDTHGNLSPNSAVFDTSASTLLFTTQPSAYTMSKHVEVVEVSNSPELLQQILNNLYERQLQSLIVEGGAKTLRLFIDQKAWDEARIFAAPIKLNKGLKAPQLKASCLKTETHNLAGDRLNIIYNR